jgi:hypothetical protein
MNIVQRYFRKTSEIFRPDGVVAIGCNRLQKLSALISFGFRARVTDVVDRHRAGLGTISLPPVLSLHLRVGICEEKVSMMNSKAAFSSVAALAVFTFMSFTPGALGQGTASGNFERGSVALGQASLSQTSLGQTSAGLLVAMLEPAPDHRRPERPSPQPPSNGCGNQRDGWNEHGGGKCSAVPEGGTTFLYLLVVGLCCVATAVFSIRRQAARVRVTK